MSSPGQGTCGHTAVSPVKAVKITVTGTPDKEVEAETVGAETGQLREEKPQGNLSRCINT